LHISHCNESFLYTMSSNKPMWYCKFCY